MKYMSWDEKISIIRKYYSFDIVSRNGKIYYGGVILMVDTLYDELETAMKFTVAGDDPAGRQWRLLNR
jgi:hypothetical protein